MKEGRDTGKGAAMLADELLKVVTADRDREIQEAERRRSARSGSPPRPGPVRRWLDAHLEPGSPAASGRARQGRAATGGSA